MVIKGIRMNGNILVWVNSEEAYQFEMEAPCKQGEAPSERVLGLLIYTYIKDMRIKDLNSGCVHLAEHLLKQFAIVKK